MSGNTQETLTEETQVPVEAGAEDKAGTTDWKREARKWEDRAKESFAELKRLREQDDASKTEMERALERITRLEEENKAKDAEILRQSVAEAKGVPADLLVGSSRDDLEAHAEKILAFRGETPAGPYVPKAGSHPAPPQPSEERKFVNTIFRSES